MELPLLLPEMLGEIRRWLNTIDRVRLQRVCRSLYALDAGPRLMPQWLALASRPSRSRRFDSLFAAAIGAGLDRRDPFAFAHTQVFAPSPRHTYTLRLRWHYIRVGESASLPYLVTTTLTLVEDLQCYRFTYFESFKDETPPWVTSRLCMGWACERRFYRNAHELTQPSVVTRVLTFGADLEALACHATIGVADAGYQHLPFDGDAYDGSFRSGIPRVVTYTKKKDGGDKQ